jgi:glycosyltransferase involved in cell wall biosynthesis
MKVLFQSYPHIGTMYGGGPTVIYNLAEALAPLGVEITFHDYWKHDPVAFDLIHYFSWFGADSWLQHPDSHPPLVVTPLSWFCTSVSRQAQEKAKWMIRVLLHRTTNRKRLGYAFDAPRQFFPNSVGEAVQLGRAHRIARDRMTIIPHGVSGRFEQGDSSLFERSHGIKDFVLCVGRFEQPRKNQLSLLRALKGEKIPLVFIGGPEPGHEQYYDQCRQEAGSGVRFLPPMKRDEPLLISAYHACKVVAMPALLESPGLTGLEGALAGANVAATQFGSTKEYFGSRAWYFDPRDLRSTREAVRAAFEAPRGIALQELVRRQYTWHRIAQMQRQAYEHVLSTTSA